MNVDAEPVVKRHTVQFYQNGDVYAGQWERTFRSGWGVLLRSNGDRYEGDWVHNCRTGLGLECLKSGQKFAGAFLSDQRCGLGVAVTATGFFAPRTVRRSWPLRKPGAVVRGIGERSGADV
mmetsp:Transcript_50004/g.131791  ORF Transcript_50004/g.131791 Transcript_50004/m.131791 type:complete len:121 (+) Transcript_50004:119-481(+)